MQYAALEYRKQAVIRKHRSMTSMEASPLSNRITKFNVLHVSSHCSKQRAKISCGATLMDCLHSSKKPPELIRLKNVQTQPFFATDIVISNPKLYTEPTIAKESRLFPYYAGYSSVFAQDVLASLPLTPGAVVFDPWNGSGTTTLAAYRLGHKAVGIDLNPAMVVAAKASLLSQLESPSLLPIAQAIIEQSCFHDGIEEDPLLQWLSPDSAASIRKIESAINCTLICKENYVKLNTNDSLDNVSPISAFFYTALFRVVRRFLADFMPSNPTWIKKPKNLCQRKRPSSSKIKSAFISEVEQLLATGLSLKTTTANKADVVIQMGNAESIPLLDKSVDAVVSSPPYCTRIDYAVSTSIELAVLRLSSEEFNLLRRSLTGTSTVGSEKHNVDPRWGKTCLDFLAKIHSHPSKASQGYYYKNHLQYFKSLSESISEISRILKNNAYCILVAQDSHYKEIHNDVPSIATEMAITSELNLVRRLDFSSHRSMVDINGHSRKYLNSRKTTESVLCFQRA